MQYEEKTDDNGVTYLVFANEDDAIEWAEAVKLEYYQMACFNGYCNAIVANSLVWA